MQPSCERRVFTLNINRRNRLMLNVSWQRLLAQTPQQSAIRRRHTLAAGVSVIALVVLAALTLFPGEEKAAVELPQLTAGQIVQATGKLRLPSGKRWLEVAEDDTGNVHIEVHRDSTVVRCIPFTRIPYHTSPWAYVETSVVIESERDWFVCVDQYDRLWVYYGRWDKQWGKLRELSCGSTRSYPPDVLRLGMSFLPSGDITPLSREVVTATGDWVGVPAEFLRRVQRATKSEPAFPAPSQSPKFTPEQQQKISRWFKRAS